jgi:hypothetical protein
MGRASGRDVSVTTNHYVPVRARVTGTLDDADLERLGVAVRRAVVRRIALAERNGQRAAGPAELVREQYAQDRRLAEETAYGVASYQRGGQQVALPVQQREPAEQTAARRIHQLLGTGVFDWFITDAEARQVLRILQRLAPEPLLRVVQMMRLTGDWNRFRRELPDSDWIALTDVEQSIDRNAGYVMDGDNVRIEVHAGGHLEGDVSLEYNVRRSGIDLMLLRRSVQIVGMLPARAAAAIADAYVEELIYVDPLVRLLVTKRGYLYAPYHGPTSQSFWVEGRSRVAATSPERPRRERRALFYAYIEVVSVRDRLTENAIHYYYRWIEQNFARSEFMTREPSDLWEWALKQASQPPPALPIQPFLDLARSMTQRAQNVPDEERARMQAALSRYLAWLDLHRDDPDLSRRNPVTIWVDAYTRVLREDIEAQSRRHARELREAREHPPIDWEAAGQKLDAAIALMTTRVWRMPEPHTVEDPEAGVGYLIWGSDLEREVRDRIASAFLHDVISRMGDPRFLDTNAQAEFRLWLLARPQYLTALALAQAHPDVERYQLPEEDIPAWQTVIEVGISFIPIVGQVVGAAEVASGYDVFGHRLSTASRAILAAGVLLPFAARTVQIGRAAVTADRLARAYRLSAPEANALFRATAKIRPGSAGARLLGDAAEDVRAGRSVDAARMRQLGGLFREMGMTERSTADVLRTRVEAELLAAERTEASTIAREAGEGGGGGPRPPRPGGPGAPTGGGGGGVSTLLGRQRGAALRTDAAELERQIASLRQEAVELEQTAARGSTPDRVASLQRRAGQRRRVATILEDDVSVLRREAMEFESGARSATAEFPIAEEVDLLLGQARAETELIQVPLARAERNPQLLARLFRPLMQSRTGNRVVFRVEGGVGRRLVDVSANGEVTLARGQTIFLNFGSAERAIEFAGKGRARIVMFEVSEDWVRSARSAAVPEFRTGALRGRQPRLVDIRFAEDQMEIPGGLVDELQQFIIPGSGRAVDLIP